jgi:hypothetical protein
MNTSSELNESEIKIFNHHFVDFNDTVNVIKNRKYYDLFVNNKLFVPNEQNNEQYSEECYHLGLYYFVNTELGNLVEKYLKFAVSLKNINAMFLLGYCYRMWREYDSMKIYLLMAVSFENSNAMNELAVYYQYYEKKYNLAKKYFFMAISFGNSDAMVNIARYYRDSKKFDSMKKYLFMAIDKQNNNAFNDIYYYYSEVENNMALACYYLVVCLKKNIDYFIHEFYNIWINIISDESKYYNKYLIIIFDKLFRKICSENIINPTFEWSLRMIFQNIDRNLNLSQYLKSNNCVGSIDFNNFLIYLGRTLYGKETPERKDKKKIINKLINESPESDYYCVNPDLILFLKKILKKKYDEYIESKFAPGGKGYLKAKKDFEKWCNEERTKKQNTNNEIENKEIKNNICN